ncbi:hypothetical protein BDY19DRAFT_904639 [Irpex rosettiformis]|uniref:Uncharacterized protein n=1 Tax=Irpex rosettiformis TaxID=378272 RepID=A0ACB8UA98_9APHY|nr:hypothetical protein BDY19DRAFT_904639 [Irpex rosettiformis]
MTTPVSTLSSSDGRRSSFFINAPEEILDRIISTVGPNFVGGHRIARCLPEKNSWLPCALVCRRWYRITLPHLFHCIIVSPDAPGDEYDFLDFVSSKPEIAPLVRGVIFHQLKLHIWVVMAMRRALPNMEEISLQSIYLQRKSHGSPLLSNYTIQRLVYHSSTLTESFTGSLAPDNFWRTTTDLLGLFSNIGQLSIKGCTYMNDNISGSDGRAAVELAAKNLTIEKLEILPPTASDLSYFGILKDLCVFRGLTGLSVTFICLQNMHRLDKMLSLLAPTLRKLDLSFSIDLPSGFTNPPESNGNPLYHASVLRNGMTALVKLSHIRIAVCSVIIFPLHPRVSLRDKSERIIGHAILNWEFALEIISMIPNRESLQELVLSCLLDETKYPMVEYDYGDLPWLRMRDVCQRFMNLNSIKVGLSYTSTTADKFKLEEESRREVREMKWKDCAKREMEGFQHIFSYEV